MHLEKNASKKMARSIRYKLYEEFYDHNPITPAVALQIVSGSLYGQYIKNPQTVKALADKISMKYFECIEEGKNFAIKEFIDEKTLKSLIEETVMYEI